MRLFHRHKWEIVSCYWAEYIPFGPFGAGDITTILFYCKCPKFKEEHINGHWTLDELKGKANGS